LGAEIHDAAKAGNLEKIKTRLAQAPKAVNEKDQEGRTPLHVAVIEGKKEAAELLIAAGADVNARDNAGLTPLHLAVSSAAPTGPTDIVELLLARGADVKAKDNTGGTPLHTATLAAVTSGRTDILELLIARGADVNAKDNAGETALLHAPGGMPFIWPGIGHPYFQEVARLLVARGAELDIFSASTLGMLERVKALLAANPDLIAVKDQYRLLATNRAVPGGYRHVVDFLEDEGGYLDPGAINLMVFIYFMAGEPGFAVKRQAEIGEIQAAVVAGDLGKVRTLLAAKPKLVRTQGADYRILLHHAAAGGQKAVAALLLSMGAPVNAREMNGRTPLHLAAEAGHKEVVELLIVSGADLNATDKGGGTAFFLANEKGHKEVVELLQRHGAKTDVKRVAVLPLAAWTQLPQEKSEETPAGEIRAAIRAGNVEKLRIMLDRSPALLNAKCRDGLTPLVGAVTDTLGNMTVPAGLRKAAELMIARGAEVDFFTACRLGLLDRVKVFLAVNPQLLCSRDPKYLMTPCDWATVGGYLHVVRFLEDEGAYWTPDVGFMMGRLGGLSQETAEIMTKRERDMVEVVAAVAVPQETPQDWERVTKLLTGNLVKARDASGQTLLHRAAMANSKDLAWLLIAKGARVNARDSQGNTPLFHAVTSAPDREIAMLLISSGVDVNAAMVGGYTALLFAAARGDKDLAASLVSHGANVNAKNDQGITALHMAADQGRRDLAELLLGAGANVNAKDNEGKTPLQYAAWADQKDMATLLMGRGAEVDIFAACGLELMDRVKTLLSARPESVGAKDGIGRTPLHWATWNGRKEAVELLIASGANVNAGDKDDATPLHKAAEKGHKDLAELLVAKGAGVNMRDKSGRTPLHSGAESGHAALADFLLAKGANIDARDNDEQTPLQLATVGGHKALVELLTAKGADVKLKDKQGRTALHKAADYGRKQIAETLIAKRADVNARDSNKATPLHLACECGHKDVAELLIAKGADVNAKDKEGETPLKKAIKAGHREVSELLRSHGGKE
jgi:ankyrin repeat protein